MTLYNKNETIDSSFMFLEILSSVFISVKAFFLFYYYQNILCNDKNIQIFKIVVKVFFYHFLSKLIY